ncbi:MAG: response regulator [Gemmatimonadetes bacterium]|nr:response regulator [Gemmatimonadota bacterium]NIR77637.1 response regulator [Gemmatimonadota bacterium]NIT86178.1 response regulator [Gemmatimonadota bacterium]NIU30002.1 response regulator [Gemmatimonadota bacterium]NIU34968.1 response regulator [Gemmatimonadota bacterium]
MLDARILLVDDDDNVRTSIRGWLQGMGATVAAAPGSSEALEYVVSAEAPFDLAVIDVALAGEDSGITLAERLYGQRAVSRFILISGYVEVSIGNLSIPEDQVAFLGKPLSVTRLESVAKELIGS